MQHRERVFDMSDPGTAKTRVEIEDFARRRATGGGKALVICPKTTMYTAWGADIEQFAPNLKYSLAYAENREAAFAAKVDFYIVNHDGVKWLAKQPNRFFKGFDTLIIDESPAYKHSTSDRSKAIRKIVPHFIWRRLMTGSPTANGICDIWHQMLLLDNGERLGDSFYHFRSSVCKPIQVGPQPNMLRWEDRPGAELAVMGLLKDITIRHEFEKCTDIPPRFEYPRYIHLSAPHMKLYEKMRKDAILELQKDTITAVNAAVLVNKLLQISSGAVYNDAGTYSLLDTERYEYILDEVEKRRHTLVFFLWQHQRDILLEMAKQRGISTSLIDGSVTRKGEREKIIQGFQDGFFKLLLLHPISAAHSVTLTRATTTIWASPTYNLEHYKQGNHRFYRVGQTQKTEVLTVIAKGTADEAAYKSCQQKKVQMTSLLSMAVQDAVGV